jgi:Kef-type K+ transport system membrane component KefB/Trk K+ transport system NAD-binding subunit
MQVDGIFWETSLVLAASAAAGAISQKLRQPLIVAFIAVGILVGPLGFNLWQADPQHELLATLGIALLLFVVGLKLDVHLIRSTGPAALVIGSGQIAMTFGGGFLLALLLGFDLLQAFYIAAAMTFSSTVIIVKLLSDKREIDALHGKIDLGVLIVQDLAVILAMIALTAWSSGSGANPLHDGLLVLLKGSVFIGLTVLLMRYVLPGLLARLARSQELLLLFAIGYAALWSALSQQLKLSLEVGAFLAGISLASTSFREILAARLVTLRDFLLLFFFISLGSHLEFSLSGRGLVIVLVMSLFVLLLKPLLVGGMMRWMGYSKRTGFLAGISLGQISEFSLILGALGMRFGHLDQNILGMITLVGVITIAVSSYLILESGALYTRLVPFLGFLQRRHPFREAMADSGDADMPVDVILFGLGNFGSHIAANLRVRGKTLLGVDFNPEVIQKAATAGYRVRYGDAGDAYSLDHLPLDQVPWVVSAMPGEGPNLALLEGLQQRDFKGKVVLTAQNAEQEEAFRKAGAHRVLWPNLDAAELAVDLLSTASEAIFDQAPWPMTLEEVRLRPGSPAGGKHLGELALRARTGATLVAVDRSGQSHFDPDVDFMLLPGDRLVLLGSYESLERAEELLAPRRAEEPQAGFQIGEVRFPDASGWIGHSLADLDLRHRIGLSVIGIRRGEQRIVSPPPDTELQAGDILVVLGRPGAIEACRTCIPQKSMDDG